MSELKGTRLHKSLRPPLIRDCIGIYKTVHALNQSCFGVLSCWHFVRQRLHGTPTEKIIAVAEDAARRICTGVGQ